jgi:hypothetical protein
MDTFDLKSFWEIEFRPCRELTESENLDQLRREQRGYAANLIPTDDMSDELQG